MASLKRNTLLGAASSVVALGATFIMNGVTSHLLPKASFGTAQFDIWVVQVVWMAANLGIPNALVRFIPQLLERSPSALKRTLRTLLAAALIGLLLGLGVVLVAARHASRADQWLMVGAFVTLGLQILMQNLHAGYQRYEPVLVGAIVYAVAGLGGVVPAVRTWGVSGYLGVNLVAQLAAAGAMALPLLRPNRLLHREGGAASASEGSLSGVVRYTWQTWLAVLISAFVWQRMELYFVNRYHSKEEVALYAVALTVGTLLTQPISLLSNALLPRFSADFARGDHASIERIYQEFTLILAAIVLFICAQGTVHASLLASALFGRSYLASGPFLALLLWGAGIGVMATPGSALVYGGGRSGFILYSGLLGVVLMLGLGFLVIARHALIWGALGKSLIQIFLIGLGTAYIWRRLCIRPPFGALMRIAGAAAVAGLLGYGLRRWIPHGTPAFEVTAVLAVSSVLFLGYLVALHLLRVFPRGGTVHGMLERARSRFV